MRQVVMVKKKDNPDGSPGGWRFCVNYAQTANLVSEIEAYPMPRVDEMMDVDDNGLDLMGEMLMNGLDDMMDNLLDEVMMMADDWLDLLG